MSVHRYK